MSLVSQITALAARIAEEFNSVRSEISALPAGTFETGTGFPASPAVGQTFFMTDEKVAYIYSGDSWLPMTFVGTIDGLSAEQQETFVLIDGKGAELSSPSQVTEGGDA